MNNHFTSRLGIFIASRRAPGAAFFTVACLSLLTGCLSRPALKTETFSFDVPALAGTNVAGAPVLGIQKITVAAPFAGRSLVYRTSEFAYEKDPYAEFLDFPEKELAVAIRAELGRQGDFSAVVSADSELKPDLMMEININQLFGDFREAKNARAILRVQFLFYQATNGIAGGKNFQKEYSRDLRLEQPTAAALMAGWNRGLDEIIGEFLNDYRARKS